MNKQAEWAILSDSQQFKAIETMSAMGGSFAVALAKCWRLADLSNRAKLEREFSDLFVKYHEMAERE